MPSGRSEVWARPEIAIAFTAARLVGRVAQSVAGFCWVGFFAPIPGPVGQLHARISISFPIMQPNQASIPRPDEVRDRLDMCTQCEFRSIDWSLCN